MRLTWREQAALLAAALDLAGWVAASLYVCWAVLPWLGMGTPASAIFVEAGVDRTRAALVASLAGIVLLLVARWVRVHFLKYAPDPELVAHPSDLEGDQEVTFDDG